MLILAYGKYDTGAKLGNAVFSTEARVTLIDAILALAVLLGLALNVSLRWWWADPVAGLVIVYYGFREGVHAWKQGSLPSLRFSFVKPGGLQLNCEKERFAHSSGIGPKPSNLGCGSEEGERAARGPSTTLTTLCSSAPPARRRRSDP